MATRNSQSLYNLGLRGAKGKLFNPNDAASLQSFLNSPQGAELSRGGRVGANDIPLNLREALQVNSGQAVNFNPNSLTQVGGAFQNQNKNRLRQFAIEDVVSQFDKQRIARNATNPAVQLTTNATGGVIPPTRTPNFAPVQESRLGGLDMELKNFVNNQFKPAVRKASRGGAFGVANLANQKVQDLLQFLNSGGIAEAGNRALSDFNKRVTKIRKGTTREEVARKLLSQQYPELKKAGIGDLQDVAGLTFTDPSNGNKYRISSAGLPERIQ